MSKLLGNFKSYFAAEDEDHCLIEVDLDQLEIKALAEVSRDGTLIRELLDGKDIHRENAANWKKCLPNEVDDKTRKAAKGMTFMMQYGASSNKMSEQLGISKDDARAFMAEYYYKYEAIDRLHESLRNWCKSEERPVPDNDDEYAAIPVSVPSHSVFKLKREYNQWRNCYAPSLTKAKNYPIQGFATGDLFPFICSRLVNNMALFLPEAKFSCTIHDSMLYYMPHKFIPRFLGVLELVFSSIPVSWHKEFHTTLTLPYTYGLSIGYDWKNMTEYSQEQVKELFHIDPPKEALI